MLQEHISLTNNSPYIFDQTMPNKHRLPTLKIPLRGRTIVLFMEEEHMETVQSEESYGLNELTLVKDSVEIIVNNGQTLPSHQEVEHSHRVNTPVPTHRVNTPPRPRTISPISSPNHYLTSVINAIQQSQLVVDYETAPQGRHTDMTTARGGGLENMPTKAKPNSRCRLALLTFAGLVVMFCLYIKPRVGDALGQS
eukprot:gb/GEZN01008775.1/.p1 GENE.gb/GEZN01008775.1/~~gb/GEZN01008775.1/.p1  ORF type:complete len:196 (+),score=8.20 gb/GEZN01008775.1/:39-626(+)